MNWFDMVMIGLGIIFVGLVILGVYTAFVKIPELGTICQESCERFDFEYWKLDNSYNCWCITGQNMPIMLP